MAGSTVKLDCGHTLPTRATIKGMAPLTPGDLVWCSTCGCVRTVT